MMTRLMTCVAVLFVFGGPRVTAADEPGAEAFLPAGLKSCVQGVQGGHVDWTCGHVIAEGRGQAPGRTDKDKFMARRAAEVVAARNALAIAAGLRIDDEGGFADIEDAEIQLQGIIRGHETISIDWRPQNQPPECIVKMKVPLWGLKSVASVIYANQQQKTLESRRQRLTLAPCRDDDSDEVLVIDARGLGIRPCLFPVVSQADGAVLYDVCTVSGEACARVSPPVRYAESDLTHMALAAQRGLRPQPKGPRDQGTEGSRGRWQPLRLQLSCGTGVLQSLRDDDKRKKHATSRPTTKPSKTTRRRRVVKAVKAAGKNKTEIVLTKEDAEKLRKDPQGAALLRAGRVVVVVDSVAAGIEGRLDERPGDMELALSNKR